MPRALITVNVQSTFCEGGALPITGGNTITEVAAAYVDTHHDKYQLIVTTQDWYIDPGPHFSETPDFVDTWPLHDVAGMAETELYPTLAHVNADVTIKKSRRRAAYSSFKGTTKDKKTLEQILHDADIADVNVVDLAESHCVAYTAVDATHADFKTHVLRELTMPVTEELGAQARQWMTSEHVEIV